MLFHITIDYFGVFIVVISLIYKQLHGLFEDVEGWHIVGVRLLSTLILYSINVTLWFEYGWQQVSAVLIYLTLFSHTMQISWLLLYAKFPDHRAALTFVLSLLLVFSGYLTFQLYILSSFSGLMALLDVVLLIICTLTAANTLSEELKHAKYSSGTQSTSILPLNSKLTHRNSGSNGSQ